MMSAKACTFSFGTLLVSLVGLAFLTSLGALFAYTLAFVSAAAALLVTVGLERVHQLARRRAHGFTSASGRL